VKPRFSPSPRSENDAQAKSYRWRSYVVLGLVVAGAIGLAARAVELQLLDHGFLAKQGDDRSMRVVKIAAHRGAITDRSGEPLAISTPVDSVWVNPQELNDNIDQLPKLAKRSEQDPQFSPAASPATWTANSCTWCGTCRPRRRRASRRWAFPA
jgi:cell division protein FtsI/penicillin-binding protein 2